MASSDWQHLERSILALIREQGPDLINSVPSDDDGRHFVSLSWILEQLLDEHSSTELLVEFLMAFLRLDGRFELKLGAVREKNKRMALSGFESRDEERRLAASSDREESEGGQRMLAVSSGKEEFESESAFSRIEEGFGTDKDEDSLEVEAVLNCRTGYCSATEMESKSASLFSGLVTEDINDEKTDSKGDKSETKKDPHQGLDNTIMNLLKLVTPTSENAKAVKYDADTELTKPFFEVSWLFEKVPSNCGIGSVTSLLKYLNENEKFLVVHKYVQAPELLSKMPDEELVLDQILKALGSSKSMKRETLFKTLSPSAQQRLKTTKGFKHLFSLHPSCSFKCEGDLVSLKSPGEEVKNDASKTVAAATLEGPTLENAIIQHLRTAIPADENASSIKYPSKCNNTKLFFKISWLRKVLPGNISHIEILNYLNGNPKLIVIDGYVQEKQFLEQVAADEKILKLITGAFGSNNLMKKDTLMSQLPKSAMSRLRDHKGFDQLFQSHPGCGFVALDHHVAQISEHKENQGVKNTKDLSTLKGLEKFIMDLISKATPTSDNSKTLECNGKRKLFHRVSWVCKKLPSQDYPRVKTVSSFIDFLKSSPRFVVFFGYFQAEEIFKKMPNDEQTLKETRNVLNKSTTKSMPRADVFQALSEQAKLRVKTAKGFDELFESNPECLFEVTDGMVVLKKEKVSHSKDSKDIGGTSSSSVSIESITSSTQDKKVFLLKPSGEKANSRMLSRLSYKLQGQIKEQPQQYLSKNLAKEFLIDFIENDEFYPGLQVVSHKTFLDDFLKHFDSKFVSGELGRITLREAVEEDTKKFPEVFHTDEKVIGLDKSENTQKCSATSSNVSPPSTASKAQSKNTTTTSNKTPNSWTLLYNKGSCSPVMLIVRAVILLQTETGEHPPLFSIVGVLKSLNFNLLSALVALEKSNNIDPSCLDNFVEHVSVLNVKTLVSFVSILGDMLIVKGGDQIALAENYFKDILQALHSCQTGRDHLLISEMLAEFKRSYNGEDVFDGSEAILRAFVNTPRALYKNVSRDHIKFSFLNQPASVQSPTYVASVLQIFKKEGFAVLYLGANRGLALLSKRSLACGGTLGVGKNFKDLLMDYLSLYVEVQLLGQGELPGFGSIATLAWKGKKTVKSVLCGNAFNWTVSDWAAISPEGLSLFGHWSSPFSHHANLFRRGIAYCLRKEANIKQEDKMVSPSDFECSSKIIADGLTAAYISLFNESGLNLEDSSFAATLFKVIFAPDSGGMDPTKTSSLARIALKEACLFCIRGLNGQVTKVGVCGLIRFASSEGTPYTVRCMDGLDGLEIGDEVEFDVDVTETDIANVMLTNAVNVRRLGSIFNNLTNESKGPQNSLAVNSAQDNVAHFQGDKILQTMIDRDDEMCPLDDDDSDDDIDDAIDALDSINNVKEGGDQKRKENCVIS